MARKTTPTFIMTFEVLCATGLKNAGSFCDLDIMSDHYRRGYNACLGHFFLKAKAMKQSDEWRSAREMPKNTEKQRKKRNKSFGEVRTAWGLDKKHFEDFVKDTRLGNIDFYNWTNSAVMQKSVADRAFSAIDKYITAKAKRVRFKKKNEKFSFAGKQNTTGVRLFHDLKRPDICLVHGLAYKVVIDIANPYHIHAFTSKVKFARLLPKTINGKKRYFIQGSFEGLPYEDKAKKERDKKLLTEKHGEDYFAEKEKLPPQVKESVAIDFGPRYAYVSTPIISEDIMLCEGLDRKQAQKRVLQRKMDRQRRKANPQNYVENGTIKKGKKKWHNTKGYLSTRKQVAEIERKKQAERKSSHGRLANKLLAYGNHIKTEDISFKAWHKMFGRSVSHHAPSSFLGELTRKAENASGCCERINTRQTALSQHCICGEKAKKDLAERVHLCKVCGFTAPRDTLSAYLAIFCQQTEIGESVKWTLDLDLAKSMLCGHRTLSSSDQKELPSNIKSKPLVSRPASSDSAAEMLATKPTNPSLESILAASVLAKESGLVEAEESSR